MNSTSALVTTRSAGIRLGGRSRARSGRRSGPRLGSRPSSRPGGQSILDAVDLTVEPGAEVAVRGRSGSGKSTLLLMLAGLLEPTSGDVAWPGLDPDRQRRRAEIGVVFQAPSLMAELTAHQNVVLPLRLRGESVQDASAAADQALAGVGATDFAGARPAQLSGGQQQRIAVARVLAGRHRLILADEPTGSLDRAHAQDVLVALRRHTRASGAGLVLASHDPELIEQFEDRLDISDGRVLRQRVAVPALDVLR